ncbi:hypothetical protein AERO9AM_11174 [Aeromicrobium sp. 9AM]|nr:hypothetical protein AERO9AM_11174 [Aeromicrobium sp. 9AM]
MLRVRGEAGIEVRVLAPDRVARVDGHPSAPDPSPPSASGLVTPGSGMTVEPPSGFDEGVISGSSVGRASGSAPGSMGDSLTLLSLPRRLRNEIGGLESLRKASSPPDISTAGRGPVYTPKVWQQTLILDLFAHFLTGIARGTTLDGWQIRSSPTRRTTRSSSRTNGCGCWSTAMHRGTGRHRTAIPTPSW